MDDALGRLYKLLSYMAETGLVPDSDYPGVKVSAISEWCSGLRVHGIIIREDELKTQPFMKSRVHTYRGLEVYYGVDFDEAANWFHSSGLISQKDLELLKLERTLYLMGDGVCP